MNTGVPVLHGGRPPVEAARDGVVTSATSAVSKAEGRRPSRRCPHLQGQHPTVRPERRGWVTVAGPGTSCRLPNTGPAMRTANRGRGRWAAACTVSSRSRGTTHPLAGPVGRGGCRAKGIPSTLSPISRARVRFVYAELGHTFTSSPAPARKHLRLARTWHRGHVAARGGGRPGGEAAQRPVPGAVSSCTSTLIQGPGARGADDPKWGSQAGPQTHRARM